MEEEINQMLEYIDDNDAGFKDIDIDVFLIKMMEVSVKLMKF